MKIRRSVKRQSAVTTTIAVMLMLGTFLSTLVGRYPKPGIHFAMFAGNDELAHVLFWNLRVPRVCTAVLLGAVLGASGMVFQMIFANPLVEPGFLGVSQGAAFGAGLSIVLLGNRVWATQGSAAAFATTGLCFSYMLARRIRFGGWILRLILAGISVSAMFTAGLGFLKYTADPLDQLPEITYWLLGGLWSVSWVRLLVIIPVVLPGLGLMAGFRWRLNLLSLNEETAYSMGAAPSRERTLLLGAAVVSTAAVISVSGIVAWVGLIVPHISRKIFGADTRFSLPGSMLIGAVFTLLCDDAARAVLAGEIPLGILSSLFGAASFLLLMISKTKELRR
jgi:iron complex transport system permease protein